MKKYRVQFCSRRRWHFDGGEWDDEKKTGGHPKMFNSHKEAVEWFERMTAKTTDDDGYKISRNRAPTVHERLVCITPLEVVAIRTKSGGFLIRELP